MDHIFFSALSFLRPSYCVFLCLPKSICTSLHCSFIFFRPFHYFMSFYFPHTRVLSSLFRPLFYFLFLVELLLLLSLLVLFSCFLELTIYFLLTSMLQFLVIIHVPSLLRMILRRYHRRLVLIR